MTVQILMSFLETQPIKALEPVWPTLDPMVRDEIVMALARLIAKAVARNETGAEQEKRDE
jgi:hypothetical protein